MRRLAGYALGALVMLVPAVVGCAGNAATRSECREVTVSAGWEYEHLAGHVGTWYSHDASGEHLEGYATEEDSPVYITARCAENGGAS